MLQLVDILYGIKRKSAAEVFYSKAHRLATKKFEEEAIRLQDNKISFAYVNTKLHRLGTIFDYEKLLKEFSDIEFAPAYEDDSDEINDEGHR